MWTWDSKDSLVTDAEENGVLMPGVQVHAPEDEVLEDAPAEQPSTWAAGLGSNLQALGSYVSSCFGRNSHSPAPDEQPWQAPLGQHHQQEKAQHRSPASQHHPPDYGEWIRSHHTIRAAASTSWERSQKRLLDEQAATLYALYHEAEKLKALIQRAHTLHHQHSQGLQEHHSSLHHHRTQTPQPSSLYLPPVHSQAPQTLPDLLTTTQTLPTTLHNTQSLITAHETHHAARVGRPARLPEIAAFFAPLHRAAERAASRLTALLHQHGSAETGGGREAQFCEEWGAVVARYGEVVWFEEAGVLGSVHGGEEWWEGYLRALGRFGEGVRGVEGRMRGVEEGMRGVEEGM